ncbi:hypothetical protein FA95DRAFT_1506053, partial [Auriscalpium vulgare]
AEACTIDNFRINIRGTPKSPWNLSAGRVFATFLLREMEWADTPLTRQGICEAFAKRIKSLRRDCREEQKTPEAKKAARSRHNKDVRKDAAAQLFQRRLSTSQKHRLDDYTELLNSLGPGGMSTDESECEEYSILRYPIRRPIWRAAEVHEWLAALDRLHLKDRQEGSLHDRRGTFPHLRYMTDEVSKDSRFRPGLPKNIYDVTWMNSKSPLWVRDVLRPKKSTLIPQMPAGGCVLHFSTRLVSTNK